MRQQTSHQLEQKEGSIQLYGEQNVKHIYIYIHDNHNKLINHSVPKTLISATALATAMSNTSLYSCFCPTICLEEKNRYEKKMMEKPSHKD